METDAKKLRLGISYGHGGENIGGPLLQSIGVAEKDETRRLGEELIACLPADRMFTAALRRQDTTVSLQTRGELATVLGCDWVMCIHVNAHRDPTIQGMEVYVLPGQDRLRERLVAQTILACAPSELRPTRLRVADPGQGGWYQRPFNVLYPYNCPAVLIEVCYGTCPAELAVLQSDWGRMAIVSALRSGVARMMIDAR